MKIASKVPPNCYSRESGNSHNRVRVSHFVASITGKAVQKGLMWLSPLTPLRSPRNDTYPCQVPPPDRGMYKYYGPGRHMAFRHQLGTKPIGKRLLLLPEPRPGPSAEPKIICHPEAGNTKYIPLSGSPPRPRQGAARGVESGGSGVARQVRHRTGQLELEGGASVCLGTMGHQPEPQ